MKKRLTAIFWQKTWQKVVTSILAFLLLFSLIPQGYAVYQEHHQAQLKQEWLDKGGFVRRSISRETEKTIDGVIESPVDELDIAFRVYKVEQPKGFVQIVHGAEEYKNYYYGLAQFLADNGYAVILSDNRGHGASINASNPSGYVSSIDDIVTDQYALTRYMKELYPDVPMTLFGHSFGSVIVRNYLMAHDEEMDKLIMEGTAHFIPISKFGVFLGNIETFYRNPRASGGLLSQLNDNDRQPEDWISHNPAFLEQFTQDANTVKTYRHGGILAIFEGDSRFKDWARYGKENLDLSILSITGSDDPIPGGKEGLDDTQKTFEKLGYTDFTSVVYDGWLHDLLHEDQTEEKVYPVILDFLER